MDSASKPSSTAMAFLPENKPIKNPIPVAFSVVGGIAEGIYMISS